MISNLLHLTLSTLPGTFSNRRQRLIVLALTALLVSLAWPGGRQGGPFQTPVGEAGAFAFTVNSSVDAVDATIGDNVCQTSVPGQCTLRAAVQEANAYPSSNNILFHPSTNGAPITLTIAGTDDIAAVGDLDITDTNTFIQGNGASNTIIRACNDGTGATPCAGVDRIFHYISPTYMAITRLTLRRGQTPGGGSAILNSGGGSMDISEMEFRNNSAGGGFSEGTGAVNTAAGVVNIRDTTFASNTGSNAGGDDSNGGALWVGNGTVSVQQSTFTGNSVGNGDVDVGGAIYTNAGTLTVLNSTFNGNTAPDGGAAIYRGGGSVSLSHVTVAQSVGTALGGGASIKNSIVTSSTGGAECLGGGYTMLGVNVVDDTSCGVAGPNIIVGDPLLAALANNGGFTQTHALPYASPAVDVAVDCTIIAGGDNGVDQRGVERPQDGKLPAGVVCDAGAFEREPNAPLIVTSTLDSVDAVPGNTRCQSLAGPCTLRAAVQEANALIGADQILFAPSIDGQPITLTIAGNDDTAAAGDLDVTENLMISGNRPLNTIVRACDDGDGSVDCAGIDRIFHVANGAAEVRLESMTLRRGNTPGGGGAIMNSGGDLTLFDMELRKNRAAGQVLIGAGSINTTAGGSLLILQSTIAENTAVGGFDDRYGGGLFMGGGSVSIIGTTFAANVVENSDADYGGGIYAHAGSLLVTNSTFDGNSSPDGGGAIHNAGASVALNHNTVTASGGPGLFGTMTVKNSVVSGSSGANCLAGVKTMQGVNVIGDATCGAAGPTIIIASPLLSALGDNGGYPQTRMPLAGSPVIDAAPDCTLISGGPVGRDQRQLPRPIDGDAVAGAVCDIGSHELSKGPVDTDGDGCTDEEESGPDRNFGGERNAFDPWDFYNVTGDFAIDVADIVAILQQFGFGPETGGYYEPFDREAYDPKRQWRTSIATGAQVGIDVSDAILNLQSFGHKCAGSP